MRRATLVAACVAGALVVGTAGAVVWAHALFVEPAARRIGSLVDELGARSIVAVFAHPDDEIKVCGLLADAGRRRPTVAARLITAARGDGGIASAPSSVWSSRRSGPTTTRTCPTFRWPS